MQKFIIIITAIFALAQCDISGVREANFLANNVLPPVKTYNLNKHALVIETTGPEGKYPGRPKEFSGYDAILPSRNYLPVASSTPGPMYLPPARPTYTTTTTTPRSISMKPLPNITYIPVPITMRPIPTRSYSFSPRPITTTTQRGYVYNAPSLINNPFAF
ncbi:uncharacterized protein LOC129792286 [Lutzomyia longipalpis]|uniref:uncharacterized protein LOC129792286 n=1 Tax=Lutzomyia longipalpis TaxID=7200 RepID=UPI0024836F4F|nr:uncharacterized protein LOC129792286 [Lutzomyia longipalpis]